MQGNNPGKAIDAPLPALRPGRAEGCSARQLALLGGAVVLATLLVFQWRWSAPGLDDAWITYRYARNIAAGHGWVYNAGERLQGASTPLYTLWLAACGFCGLPIPAASAVTCALATCGTTLATFLFLARRHSALAGLVAVALILFSPFLRTAVGGMETALYVFLCLSALFSAGAARWRISFVAAGLAMFTRLDGAAVLAVVAFWHLMTTRRIPVRHLIFPVALNLAWFVFATWYFGKPLPNSFYAKRFHSGHAHFSWWMIRAILVLPPTMCLFALAGVGCVAYQRRGSLFVGSAPRTVSGDSGGTVRGADPTRMIHANLAPLLIWAAGYVAAYSLSQLEFYAWYVAPMIVVVCILAGIGAGGLAEMMPRDRRWRFPVVAILAAFSVTPAWADAWRVEDRTLEQARYDGARYAATHVPRTAIIEAAGIGDIGWWTDNTILDAAGLVSPKTLAERPAPWFWHALGDVAERDHPDFIFDSVATNLGWPAVILRDYHPIATFPHKNGEFTGSVSIPLDSRKA